jgi:osmotically-inducible protein OsmY
MTSNRQIERNERDLQADAVRRLGRTDQRPLQDVPEAGRFAERRSWMERTKDEVASWFGNTEAMRRRQWDEAAGDHSGEGPARFVDSDTRIVEVLENRLTVDRDLDASNIQVACSEGVVSLGGTVTTSAGAQRAENLAIAVHGVTRVVNNLVVA